MTAADHENTIREAFLAAKDAWFSGRVFDDGQIHVQMSIEEFNERVAVGTQALDALLSEHAAELARARLDVREWAQEQIERAQLYLSSDLNAQREANRGRLHAMWDLLERFPALAAAQEPPAERSRTICGENDGHGECVKHANHDGPHSWEPPAEYNPRWTRRTWEPPAEEGEVRRG